MDLILSTANPLDPSFASLLKQLEALWIGQWLADFANTSAFLFYELKDLNWVGFYFASPNGDLTLGPFQGLPACTILPSGKGVCGRAWRDQKTVVVEDVHAFPGHISCDARSRSEIVIPFQISTPLTRLAGVLDVDSPLLNRFGQQEKLFLETALSLLVQRQSHSLGHQSET